MIKRPTPEEMKEARTEAGLTQAQAAHVIGKSEAMWQIWETGKNGIDPYLWYAWKHLIAEMKKSV